MMKLYGISISNYFSVAKAAFLEKGVPFEEVPTMPGDAPEVVAASPMGKVPYVVREDGSTLSETNVIFDYLEEIQPNPRLYPSDSWEKAKTKEIIRTVELYVDAAARALITMVDFGAPRDEAAIKSQSPVIEKGLGALKQLAVFEPFIAGKEYSYADIAAYFHLQFTNLHTTKLYDWDIYKEDQALAEYKERVSIQPMIKQVSDQLTKDLNAFLSKGRS